MPAVPTAYTGPIKAVIFDWAGTTMDFGCLAPPAAFTELFHLHGVEATVAEAREPMGQHKRDHIRAMLTMPRLAAAWTAAQGSPPDEAVVKALFQEFIPLQLEAIRAYCDLIPGVLETVAKLEAQGIRIGTTTGYNTEMMNLCLGAARAAGYCPTVNVAVDQVPAGRPAPWMALQAAMQLGVYPPAAIVKVGDTVADVQEGLNAGMWSVAVVDQGNEVGLSREELAALPAGERSARTRAAAKKLADAGAHYVIPTIDHLPDLIEKINRRA